MVLCLLLPALCASASAYSILWVSTSDCTCLVKDEEYVAAPALMTAVPGVDDDAPLLVEETDSGLEILYEELGPPEELAGVDEVVQPEPISVEEVVPPETVGMEEEPETLEEIELEEIINDEIQIP